MFKLPPCSYPSWQSSFPSLDCCQLGDAPNIRRWPGSKTQDLNRGLYMTGLRRNPIVLIVKINKNYHLWLVLVWEKLHQQSGYTTSLWLRHSTSASLVGWWGNMPQSAVCTGEASAKSCVVLQATHVESTASSPVPRHQRLSGFVDGGTPSPPTCSREKKQSIWGSATHHKGQEPHFLSFGEWP